MHKINKLLYWTTRLERHWGDKYVFVWLVVHLLNKLWVISPILCIPMLSQLESTHLSTLSNNFSSHFSFSLVILPSSCQNTTKTAEFLIGYMSTQTHSHELMKGLQISSWDPI